MFLGSRATSTGSRSASILFQSLEGTYREDSEDSQDRDETYEESFTSPRRRMSLKTSTKLKSKLKNKKGQKRSCKCTVNI